MALRAAAKRREAFLVEHYWPGLDADALRRCVARVRATVAELERQRKPMRFLGSTIVPSDESFLCVIEAASEQLIREAYARAGIPFERISPALTDEG
jgi:hypothetical protein